MSTKKSFNDVSVQTFKVAIHTSPIFAFFVCLLLWFLRDRRQWSRATHTRYCKWKSFHEQVKSCRTHHNLNVCTYKSESVFGFRTLPSGFPLWALAFSQVLLLTGFNPSGQTPGERKCCSALHVYISSPGSSGLTNPWGSVEMLRHVTGVSAALLKEMPKSVSVEKMILQ